MLIGLLLEHDLFHVCNVHFSTFPLQKEPGTKASKGAKGKKEEKQEAGKEGTAPSENGENRADEVHFKD